MNAEQARKLTQSNVTINVEPILSFIFNRIKEAAKRGEYFVKNPFEEMQGIIRSEEKQEATLRLIALGYQIIEHSKPDPGHPCSRPCTVLKWNY